MNKQTEALKIIDEAIKELQNVGGELFDESYEKVMNKLQACKEALEQPAQEPVAWMDDLDEDEVMPHAVKIKLGCSQYSIPLYTHPILQIAQKPIAYFLQSKNKHEFSFSKPMIESEYLAIEPLYTHPAPSWQGLSDDERHEVIVKHVTVGCTCDPYEFARAIEQKLKEKNER